MIIIFKCRNSIRTLTAFAALGSFRDIFFTKLNRIVKTVLLALKLYAV